MCICFIQLRKRKSLLKIYYCPFSKHTQHSLSGHCRLNMSQPTTYRGSWAQGLHPLCHEVTTQSWHQAIAQASYNSLPGPLLVFAQSKDQKDKRIYGHARERSTPSGLICRDQLGVCFWYSSCDTMMHRECCPLTWPQDRFAQGKQCFWLIWSKCFGSEFATSEEHPN